MKTLVVENFPDHLHAMLREQARRNRRSVTKETVAVLEQALGGGRQPPKLSPPLRLRGGYRPSIEDIEAAIAEGRD